jgi:hypothetical protein
MDKQVFGRGAKVRQECGKFFRIFESSFLVLSFKEAKPPQSPLPAAGGSASPDTMPASHRNAIIVEAADIDDLNLSKFMQN